MQALVSVIIPVFNVCSFLREALDSVIHQSYQNLEIIIVDDGSTDGSGSICDEYRDDPRVCVIHQENGGLSNARNVGLEQMTGEYVAFLDSDDAYHPDFIRLTMEAMARERPEMVVCRHTAYHTVRKMIPDDRDISRPSLKAGKYDRVEALRALGDGKIDMIVWNKLYKAELWDDIRFPEGRNYEDLDTIYRIMDKCQEIVMLDRPLVLRRKRSGSITKNFTMRNVRDKNLAHSHWETFIREHTPEVFNKEHLMKCRRSKIVKMMCWYGQINTDSAFRRELRSEILSLVKNEGMEGYSFKIKLAYNMIRFFPWLFKIVYLVCRTVIRMNKRALRVRSA